MHPHPSFLCSLLSQAFDVVVQVDDVGGEHEPAREPHPGESGDGDRHHDRLRDEPEEPEEEEEGEDLYNDNFLE